MEENFTADVVSIWDGADKQSPLLAELRFRFTDLKMPEFQQHGAQLLLLMKIDELLQPLADQRFGKGKINVDSKELREGSIDLIVHLAAAGAALYVFCKDYKDLREGVLLFVNDVKSVSSELRVMVKRYVSPKREHDDANRNKGNRSRGA